MKNLLVEYKGGGYDGCFWEWNYFGWNSDGDFCNILSTGYKGVKNESQALAITKENEEGVTIVNMNRQDRIIDFVDNGNASLMNLIADHDWYFKEKMSGHCTICGELHDVSDMMAGSYSGDGGIVVSAKDLVCENCYYTSDDSDFYPIAELHYENIVLKIGDYHHCLGGRSYYSYVMLVGGEVMFSGNDFSPSPMSCVDSLESLLTLLGFLTLKPGDTDNEYFMKYTLSQLDFAKSNFCEDLSMIVYDLENDQSEYWHIDINDEENVYTVTGGE